MGLQFAAFGMAASRDRDTRKSYNTIAELSYTGFTVKYSAVRMGELKNTTVMPFIASAETPELDRAAAQQQIGVGKL